VREMKVRGRKRWRSLYALESKETIKQSRRVTDQSRFAERVISPKDDQLTSFSPSHPPLISAVRRQSTLLLLAFSGDARAFRSAVLRNMSLRFIPGMPVRLAMRTVLDGQLPPEHSLDSINCYAP
jgi:hypothetical protein